LNFLELYNKWFELHIDDLDREPVGRQTYDYLPNLRRYSFRIYHEGWPGWVDLVAW